MRKAWTWLLYRLGIRKPKPKPFNELVAITLRAHTGWIVQQATRSNALLRHLKDMK